VSWPKVYVYNRTRGSGYELSSTIRIRRLRMKPVQDKVNDPLKTKIVFMAQRPPDIKLVKE